MLRHRSHSRGFSLIELLIVVTVILIIAAIAIPRLMTVKQEANATAAVGNLHSLMSALNLYATEYPNIGYPPVMTALGPPSNGATASSAAANLIDESAANAATTPKEGYLYTYTPASGTPSNSFSITAAPQNGAGTRYYYMDQDGVVRFNDGSPATASSPIIG